MKRKLFALFALCVLWSVPASAQVTITYSFTNGTTADADQVNANFTALGTAALNRTGGTITGAVLVNAGVTIDGIDIGAVLGGTGTPTFSTVTTGTLATTNTGAASLDVGGGLNIGTGNVSLVDTTGKITAISSTYFANLSGANLTSLTAANVVGTLQLAQGGTGTTFGGGITQGDIIYIHASGVFTNLVPGTAGQFLRTGGAAANPSWSNDGSNLTALVATNLASGTVPDARLSGTYSGALTFSSGSNVFTAAYKSADGSAGVTSTTCNFTVSITVKNGLIVGGTGC